MLTKRLAVSKDTTGRTNNMELSLCVFKKHKVKIIIIEDVNVASSITASTNRLRCLSCDHDY